MTKFDTPGQKLIAQTPLSLVALTRHDVEPHEEHWFARCRTDYLRNFPLLLQELVRLCMVLALVGPAATTSFAVFALSGWGLVMAAHISVRNNEVARGADEKTALRHRAGTIRLRMIWWSGMLAWAVQIAAAPALPALIAFGLAMMVIDGLSVLSLPRLALASSAAGAVALAGSLVARDGVSAAPVAVVALLMISFLHWSLYNLYYLFATRRIRTRRLRESNETIRLLLNQYDDEGSDWLYEIDGQLRIRNPSARFCSACGLDPAALEGTALLSLVSDGPQASELAHQLEQGLPFRGVVVPVSVGDEERWWSVNGRPVDRLHGQEPGWRGFIADISAAREAEARVAFMAHYDLLTQLPNRTLFAATLERAFHRLRPGRILALLYIDLDHFKAVNDGHGHAAGDQLLTEVARRLEAVVRPRDMVARLGGDEFVVLMTDCASSADALAVAERVLATIGNTIEIDGMIMPIGASVGLAFAPGDATCGDELLRAADMAMYDAKSRGRRGISVFDPTMQQQMHERRRMEIDLRMAISHGELELHYQPLLDIASGAVAGYEALLRWNHPSRGTVAPDAFIPLAEETGVIVEIGEWVIRSALAEATTWPEHLTVAVNMSPAQVKDGNLLATVIHALAASGVAPHRLELEITENLLMQESDEILATLHKLRGLGVRIALDDFGTGYSSLNYLRSFPFDKIKIDRCFVSEMAVREDCQAIVRSVIALANELNMTTTAEGVECGEQLEALRRDGCHQAQGFYYSRARPAWELGHGDSRRAVSA